MNEYEIIIVGWNPGFNKVQTSKLFRTELGDNIADSKRRVDRIMRNETVVISTGSPQQLERMQNSLIDLGAKIQE